MRFYFAFCSLIRIFANEMKVKIYEHTAELPEMRAEDFFHSPTLMALLERTPRQKPLMAVATNNDGHVVGHMLVSVRYRRSWFPPYLYTHARILGEGEYEGEKENAFRLMLDGVKRRLNNKVLYFELSNLSEKMFGYGALRQAGFFAVKWMSVHNSLHSRTPEERIAPRLLKRIENAISKGVETKVVETDEEFRQFSKLLYHHHWLKPRRFIPNEKLFRNMMEGGHCKLFVTKYREHVIGCSVLVYSRRDAYLWYSAAKRKSFAPLHPNAVTYWNTIKDAYADGYEHIRFMDVGLPFRKNIYRDFILRFGGKEVSTYRWFYISIRWVNAIASWLWRE
jgi:hypothetical protein